jgi:hypothetical protein
MLKLKTKWFDKWSKKYAINDNKLLKAIGSIPGNLGIVDLGAGLYKLRIAGEQRGKSGGFRSIVVFRKSELAVFVYGFSKTEKDNLNQDELKYFKKLAKDLIRISRDDYNRMIQQGDFIQIEEY